MTSTTSAWIDLSQPYFEGMPASRTHGGYEMSVNYFNLPYDPPVHARTSHVQMAAHMGTHIDSACHFIKDGKTIEQYPTDVFVGPGVAIDVRREGPVPITAAELEAADPGVEPGDIVLLYCGYAERFRAGEAGDHPYLAEDAAQWLVDRAVKLVGMDVVTPDLPDGHRPEGFSWPVHHVLLGADVLIIENLGPGLAEVAGHRLEIVARPMRLEGSDGAPVVPLARVVD